MGLQEGVRQQLRPEELTELEKQRQEERLFEQKMTLRSSYERARRALLIAAVSTLVIALLLPHYSLLRPFAAQIAQFSMAWGNQGNKLLAYVLAALVGLFILGLWWLSRKRPWVMIMAALVTVLDVVVSFFTLSYINMAQNLANEAAGASMELAAGNGASLAYNPYQYMTSFMIILFVHGVMFYFCIYGYIKGTKMNRVPETSIQEKKVEKAVYYDGTDYTEHPDESCAPIRPAEKGAVTLLKAEVAGMTVTVERAWAVTYLAVDGQVYNDQKGKVEPLYHLRACVGGVHLVAENKPMTGYSLLTLTADGVQVAQKHRVL